MIDSMFAKAPANWRVTTMGELRRYGWLDVQVGFRPTFGKYNPQEYGTPVILMESIEAGRINHHGIARLRATIPEPNPRFKVLAGDILVSRRGDLTRRALIGPAESGWICGCGFLKLRFQSGLINPHYAFHYLNQPAISTWLIKRASGSTVPHINTSVLDTLPFVLPPLNEQREITDLLRTVQDKLDLNQAMNATLIALADAHFKRALNGVSTALVALGVPQDALPEGYAIQPLKDCCTRIENGRTPRNNDTRASDGSMPWLASAELRNGVLTVSEHSISRKALLDARIKIWPKGATVVAMVGATAGQIGWLAMEASANQACCGLVAPPHLQSYLYFYMSSLSNTLRRMAKGSAQQHLNQKTIAELPVVIPAREIAEELENILCPLLDLIASNHKEMAALTKLRDTLLPRILSGELKSRAKKRAAGVLKFNASTAAILPQPAMESAAQESAFGRAAI